MNKAHEIVRTGLTFAEFFRRFPDDTAAAAWFESRRWPNGPHCDSDRITSVASRRPMPYRCKDCRKHFSVMSHTVMHQSKLGCQTWLLALFLIVSNPKVRSSVQLAADLGVTQKTAWHLAHRIRQALTDGGMAGFGGPVEAAESMDGCRFDLPGFDRISRLTLVWVATVFDEQVGSLLKLIPVHHRIRVRTQRRPWILA